MAPYMKLPPLPNTVYTGSQTAEAGLVRVRLR